jgi:hypothetical protein
MLTSLHSALWDPAGIINHILPQASTERSVLLDSTAELRSGHLYLLITSHAPHWLANQTTLSPTMFIS